MSNLQDFGFDPHKASAFNEKNAASIGWLGSIPQKALEAEPQLKLDYRTLDFAEGVHDIQRVLFPGDEVSWDGKLGKGTWKAILSKYDRVEGNYIIFQGRRIQLPKRDSYIVVSFDQPGGLDLHREGDFQRGREAGRPLNALMWHWGAHSAKSLYNAFENAVFDGKGKIIEDPREVSSHGGIELGADGVVRFYQFLDFWHRAWHAGVGNPQTIGLDICQQPTEREYAKLKGKGWDVQLIDNPSNPRRGDRKIVTLEPRIATAARHLTEDLCAVLSIPFQIPKGTDGLLKTGDAFYGVIPEKVWKSGKPTGVFGHHHCSSGKWDIAPWWHQLFGDLH